MAEYAATVHKRNAGVIRLFPDSDLRGEFTIVVADDFQGCGLGTKFIEVLIDIARAKGLKSIYGTVLPDNNKMLFLMNRQGFSIARSMDGEVEVVLTL